MLNALDRVLTDREKQIIIHRYGILGSRTEDTARSGRYLGISRSYVSRIEKKALEKLRRAMES